jgi:hypothetical protein
MEKLANPVTIDCGIALLPPSGSKILENSFSKRIQTKIVWNTANVQLIRSPQQEGGGSISGLQVLGFLDDKPVLPAHVLEVLAHYKRELIPNAWKERVGEHASHYFFPGTFYESEEGFPEIHGMFWNERYWEETARHIEEEFYQNDYFAIWQP